MSPTPTILVLAYNRPQFLQRLLESISDWNLPLLVHVDGADELNNGLRQEVLSVCERISWSDDMRLIAADQHKGLKTSVFDALSATFGWRDEPVIVLEDDLVMLPAALSYFVGAAGKYSQHKQIGHISSYSQSWSRLGLNCTVTWASRFSQSWGWATWPDRWEAFLSRTVNMEDLSSGLKYLGARPGQIRGYLRSVERAEAGAIDSWAIPWNAHMISAGMFSATSPWSLVDYLGWSGGTHMSDHASDVVRGALNKVPEIPSSPAPKPEVDRLLLDEIYAPTAWRQRLERKIKKLRRYAGRADP